MGKYVLAMYDIRGKQEYIFRSNHLQEIMGGSAVIEDCFQDYLYPQAVDYRNKVSGEHYSTEDAIFNYKKDGLTQEEQCFSVQRFRERMEGGQYLGEVVYDGGGNFFVLYKDRETCIEINRRFTKKVLQETATLKVLCTYIEVTLENYRRDRDALYEKHRIYEAREGASMPAQALPFTQVDYLTSMPLCEKVRIDDEWKKVSRESYCKYKKYQERYAGKPQQGEVILDKLVTEKGKDSYLAIIYIDGNSMGAKVQRCLKDKSDYDDCVNALRQFSGEIQNIYIDERRTAVDAYFEDKYGTKERRKHRRFVVSAGDEVNFICNASDALDVVKAYFADMPQGHSACAGVAIFHSHAPYSEAYRIAEECCESGKRKMKEEKLEEASLIDVHYCQGGIGTELETIREKEVGNLISKPWFLYLPEDEKRSSYVTLQDIEAMADEMGLLGHSNVKSLAEHAKNSLPNLKMELERIRAHGSVEIAGENSVIFRLLDKDLDEYTQHRIRSMIYDAVILYDLWFRRENTGRGRADE